MSMVFESQKKLATCRLSRAGNRSNVTLVNPDRPEVSLSYNFAKEKQIRRSILVIKFDKHDRGML